MVSGCFLPANDLCRGGLASLESASKVSRLFSLTRGLSSPFIGLLDQISMVMEEYKMWDQMAVEKLSLILNHPENVTKHALLYAKWIPFVSFMAKARMA